MLHISESAARQLRSLIDERDLSASEGLRLFVERGGCAGLQYGMEIGAPASTDKAFERDGARVFVEEESLQYLEECTLDYADDLSGGGFKVINPKAVRSCGCGTSFEPAASENGKGA